MSSLYACVYAAEFPAQALLRLRGDKKGEPVCVLEGSPPQEVVCARNARARMLGVARGMTRLDAEAIAGVQLLARSRETEGIASSVLKEICSKYSPRLEEASEDLACALVLDITGTERLFGPPVRLAGRLRADLQRAGLRVSVAVSANFHAARMKAAASRGITVIPEGEERAALEKLPVTALQLDGNALETFAIWGIRTLGELAALPAADLISRLGQQARAWREAALGAMPHLFEPIEEELALREFFDFEDPVEEMDSLLFMGARMVDGLVARAADRALALARVTARMKLEGGATHELTLRPAVPSADRKFLLKLLHLELAAHPPQAAVMSLELSAEAAQSSVAQLGLFTPQAPEPSRLDVTLARLRAVVGEDRVGAAVLEDSHRPGSFRMRPFAVDAKTVAGESQSPRMALRRMRPAVPVRVKLRGQEPEDFWSRAERFEVTAAYGPWRTSGCWWAVDKWELEEWDVLAVRGDGERIACLLVHDRNEWRLEAVYD